MPLGEGGSHERGGEREARTPLKRRYYAVTGSFNVKIVADRHRRAAYHNKRWRRASYEC